MENWMENKKVHEGIWGGLYHRVISNNKSFNDLKSEWLDLFRFEMKGVEYMEYRGPEGTQLRLYNNPKRNITYQYPETVRLSTIITAYRAVLSLCS